MRQILCDDKGCDLLPSTQSPIDIKSDNIKTTSAGLVLDSSSTSIPLNSARSSGKRRQRRMKGARGKKSKRVKKVQVGGKRKKKPVKNQKGGKRRCVKKSRK